MGRPSGGRGRAGQSTIASSPGQRSKAKVQVEDLEGLVCDGM